MDFNRDRSATLQNRYGKSIPNCQSSIFQAKYKFKIFLEE